ncbi:MAG: GAF domain-containing protein [Hyphomicrobiales bacterium]
MAKKGKDYFKALYDVARVINASLKPEEVLAQIVQCAAKAMEVKACSLRVLDSKRERLLMGGSWGLSKGYIRKGPVLVKESGLDQKALRGRTVWIENAQTDKDFQYQGKARAEGIISLLVVPLMLGKKAIGVLRVYSSEVRKFDQDEVQFLQAVAHLSAIAMENARMHQVLRTDFDLLVAHGYRVDDN